MTINGYPQGVSTEKESIKQSYWYYMASHTIKFCQNRSNPRVLMLGLGANTIPTLIARINPKVHLTLVEIDPNITQACQEFFQLNLLPNFQLIQTDAYQLIDKKQSFNKNFDVILVDIYIGKPPYVSVESNQPSFIKKLLKYLKKDGMIIFNRPGHNENARADSEALQDYLSTIFTSTRLADFKDPRGYRSNEVMGLGKR